MILSMVILMSNNTLESVSSEQKRGEADILTLELDIIKYHSIDHDTWAMVASHVSTGW